MKHSWPWFSVILLYLCWLMKPICSQGLACYRCMTNSPDDNDCADPFSSINNRIENNCQATSKGKNGTFPARFCMKISGRILSLEGNVNGSFLNSHIYYRSCLVDNIMDSTKSLETSGNFRLKGFLDPSSTFRVQGSMSLCTFDGCNHADRQYRITSMIIVVTLFNLLSKFW